MRRLAFAGFLVVVVAASAVGTAVVWDPGPGRDADMSGAWGDWLSLPVDARLRRVREYHELRSLTDARQVTRWARQFARMAPEARQELRALQAVIEDVIASQPAAHRRALSGADARGRAAAVFQILEHEQPHRIAELREMVRRP